MSLKTRAGEEIRTLDVHLGKVAQAATEQRPDLVPPSDERLGATGNDTERQTEGASGGASVATPRTLLPASATRVAIDVGQACAYCAAVIDGVSVVAHWEHVVPRSRRGPDSPINLVIACATCNLRKGDRLPSEWLDHDKVPALVAEIERRVLSLGAGARVDKEAASPRPRRNIRKRVTREDRIEIERLIERNDRTWDTTDIELPRSALFADSDDFGWLDHLRWCAAHGSLSDTRHTLAGARAETTSPCPYEAAIQRLADDAEDPLVGVDEETFERLMDEAASDLFFMLGLDRGSHITMPDDSMVILLWDTAGGGPIDEDIDWITLDEMSEWSVRVVRVDDDGECECTWADKDEPHTVRWHVTRRLPRELRDSMRANWTNRVRDGGLSLAYTRALRSLHHELSAPLDSAYSSEGHIDADVMSASADAILNAGGTT